MMKNAIRVSRQILQYHTEGHYDQECYKIFKTNPSASFRRTLRPRMLYEFRDKFFSIDCLKLMQTTLKYVHERQKGNSLLGNRSNI
jgi:hypothetical protein